MNELHIKSKPIHTRIAVVPRHPIINQQIVLPIGDRESSEMKSTMQKTRKFSSLTSKVDSTKPSWRTSTDQTLKKSPMTPTTLEIYSKQSKAIEFTRPNRFFNRIKQWYSGLTSRQKILLRIIIVTAVILILTTAIILPVLFLVILPSLSTTSIITTSITTTSVVISALWTFDQTSSDYYGVYNGSFINGASYLSASTTQPYIGNGRALNLLASSNQSFDISNPLINLNKTSFTVEGWIYPTNITGDRPIFCQCACSTCTNQCFYLIIRSSRLYIDFMLNSLSGSTTLSINTWYHIAFVYDYSTNQQILYLKGIQDAIKSNSQPYQGINASIQIGSAQIFSGTYYYNGYIDNVRLTTRAKTSTEILFDASVTAYYSFDASSLNNDNGPNGLNGLSVNTIIVSGRVNEAMRFSGLYSYFQAYGFYQFIYSINNQPFSLSLWINPSSISSSTIVQVTQQQSSGSCFNFIGITSPNSGLTGQLMVQGYYWPILYGSFLTINTWTHVSVTYSTTNGLTLYVNGIRFGSTGAFTLSNPGLITWLQIGYNFPSTGGNVPNNGYQGSIDEVYVHSRELSQTDITTLANP